MKIKKKNKGKLKINNLFIIKIKLYILINKDQKKTF